MGGLSEFAAKLREVADRAESSLALEACRAGSRDYVTILRVVTPKRSGALADSEHVWSVSGGGESATATLGPDIIYDRFRNDGGTITVKHAKVLTDGGSFFGKSVTQAGSHYMERARGPGAAALAQACRVIADEIISL